jgi:hypothetical protein
MVRIGLVGLAAALTLVASLGVVARAAASAPQVTVPCDENIGHPKSGREAGYRLVLGTVSVPPAYLPQVIALHTRPWPYWKKAGLRVWSASCGGSIPPPPWAC